MSFIPHQAVPTELFWNHRGAFPLTTPGSSETPAKVTLIKIMTSLTPQWYCWINWFLIHHDSNMIITRCPHSCLEKGKQIRLKLLQLPTLGSGAAVAGCCGPSPSETGSTRLGEGWVWPRWLAEMPVAFFLSDLASHLPVGVELHRVTQWPVESQCPPWTRTAFSLDVLLTFYSSRDPDVTHVCRLLYLSPLSPFLFLRALLMVGNNKSMFNFH